MSAVAAETGLVPGILSRLPGMQSGAQPSTTGQDAGAGQQGKPRPRRIVKGSILPINFSG
jgi:hypothetical protein